jgi:hypothetical protein
LRFVDEEQDDEEMVDVVIAFEEKKFPLLLHPELKEAARLVAMLKSACTLLLRLR